LQWAGGALNMNDQFHTFVQVSRDGSASGLVACLMSAVAARLDCGIEGSPPPRIGMSER
jgi:hypothetical protein